MLKSPRHRHCCLRVAGTRCSTFLERYYYCLYNNIVIAHRILLLFSQPTYRRCDTTPHAHRALHNFIFFSFFLIFSSRFSLRSRIFRFPHLAHCSHLSAHSTISTLVCQQTALCYNRRVQKLQSCWILRHEIENWTKLERKELLLFFL